MGVDVTLNRHGSGLMNSQATDDNADIIEGGFAETLSRTNPNNNAMQQPLDMNGFEILNLGGQVGGDVAAEDVSYDNTTSGLVADNAQLALDEIQGNVDTTDSRVDSTESRLDTIEVQAIRSDTASQISVITEKVSPASADLIVIEDSADSNNKKRVQIGNLPSGGGGPAGDTISNGTSSVGIPNTNGSIMFNVDGSAFVPTSSPTIVFGIEGRWAASVQEDNMILWGNDATTVALDVYNDDFASSTAKAEVRLWHNGFDAGGLESFRTGDFTSNPVMSCGLKLRNMYQSVLIESFIITDDGRLSTYNEQQPDCVPGGMTFTSTTAGYTTTIKDPGVAHGVTSLLETDTFSASGVLAAGVGGLLTVSATETDVAFRTTGISTTPVSSDTGDAPIDLNASLKSGTTTVAHADASNLVSVSNNGATRLVVKGNGDIVSQGGITLNGQVNLRSYTVGTLPSASIVGGFIYVSDETGGAIPCFSDGTNWRRVTDRAIAT
jgi:hypothetical protein